MTEQIWQQAASDARPFALDTIKCDSSHEGQTMTRSLAPLPDGEGDTTCVTGARRCRDEIPRQTAHLVLGIGAGLMILVVPQYRSVAILAGALLAGSIISDALAGTEAEDSRLGRFVGTFVRKREKTGGGANYTGLSVLASLIFFPAPSAAAASIGFGVLDAASTLVGLRFGRRRLPNGKSAEGTLAAFAITLPLLLFFLSPLAATAVAITGALAELVLPVNDNLVVPFLLALLATAVA